MYDKEQGLWILKRELPVSRPELFKLFSNFIKKKCCDGESPVYHSGLKDVSEPQRARVFEGWFVHHTL